MFLKRHIAPTNQGRGGGTGLRRRDLLPDGALRQQQSLHGKLPDALRQNLRRNLPRHMPVRLFQPLRQ